MSNRIAHYPILDIIIKRWSPRALSGESIAENEFFQLCEAARWAPSSYNNQPWNFVYAQREDYEWNSFLDLLVPFNRSWAQEAAILVIVASDTLFKKTGKFSRTHMFDTGAACENFALQGFSQGLVVHSMEGFDYDKAKVVAQFPEHFEVCAMIAVRKPGNPKDLSIDLQDREKPSDRRPIDQWVSRGKYENER